MKKIISIAMALITVVMFGTVVTGCHVNNQEQIDKTKTQLYVSNIDKGQSAELAVPPRRTA